MTHSEAESRPESEPDLGRVDLSQREFREADHERSLIFKQIVLVLDRIQTWLCWVGLVVSVAALVYVLTQVPWTTTVEYSRRNGRAPVLVLLGFPVIFWWFVRPTKKTVKKEKNAPREPKRGDIYRVIAAMTFLILGVCCFIFGQLYMAYEFLREGGALG